MRSRTSLIVVFVCVLALVPLQAQAAPCSTTLQALIDAAPAGSVVNVPACVYRESATINKPLTLAGQPGAEIRGSDIWNDWQPADGLWISQQTLPPLPEVNDTQPRCADPNNRCLRPEQVFVDGQPFYPLGTGATPSSGEFALDDARHILLADDPTGRLVEVSTRTRWIVTAANNVTIQGFSMKHAANDAQTGGVANDGFANWTLQDNVLAYAHGGDVFVDRAPNIRVLRNDISAGGNLGIAGWQISQSLIAANHLHDNGTDEFNRNWSMGGLKISEVQDVVVDGNESDHNGSGFWCDVGCRNVTFSNNRIHDNPLGGIIFEISDGGAFHDNVGWENGWGPVGWVWGAGILISSSTNTEIWNNVMAWNASGISVVDQTRPKPFDPFNHFVHDNTIIRQQIVDPEYWRNMMLAFTSDNGTGPGTLFDPDANVRGLNNSFWMDTPENPQNIARFAWYQGYGSLSEFSDTPGGTGSHYISAAEKDDVLVMHNIPSQPSAAVAAPRF
ncbi:MAG: right-handed parallel beta-helix repeat-containing protein [Chloroflexi bacterium]|nr:right-handed parallel beta-helix repeat-containing protein [Chloroflexota bacterium]